MPRIKARYLVQTEIPPALIELGFVAWVSDTRHPDLWPITEDPRGLSVSWHQSMADAERTANALNDRDRQARVRATLRAGTAGRRP